MQGHSKRLFPIDVKDRRELAQVFCLALRNVQAYGGEHTVSATTLQTFYQQLINLLDRFPEIVWSHTEGKILLNGEPCELRTADDVLAQRMAACSLETFSFLDSITRRDVQRFVKWLATGIDDAAGESYEGIHISDAVYARVAQEQEERQESDKGSGESSGAKNRAGNNKGESSVGVKQFDLDSMLTDSEDGDAFGSSSSLQHARQSEFSRYVAQQQAFASQRKSVLEQIQAIGENPKELEDAMDQFLSMGGTKEDWQHLCLQAKGRGQSSDSARLSRETQIKNIQQDLDALQKRCAMGHFESETVAEALDKLRGSLDGLIHTMYEQTDSLVDKVNADRLQIAKLEAAARESGAPIHLSREELLESLAEINQELAQPLTVSSALVEMLSSGRMGDVDAKQQKVFDLAANSLQRLETVVKYLQRISGMPVNLIPDQDLLDEVYGSSSDTENEV